MHLDAANIPRPASSTVGQTSQSTAHDSGSHIPWASSEESSANQERVTTPIPLYASSALLLYVAIGLIALVTLILLYGLYELYKRFMEEKALELFDGGPPLVSGQKANVYTFNIKVAEAGSNFDITSSIIRIDLLDHYNQYLTTVTVPAFVFKFRAENGLLDGFEGFESTVYPKKPPPPETLVQRLNYKSISDYYDLWSGKRRGETISFRLLRASPLYNLAAIRLSHDCFGKYAHLTFEHLTIKDEQSGQEASSMIQGKRIQAISACQPDSFQVFPLERVSTKKE